MLTCEHPQSGFYFLLKRSFGKVGQLCRAVHLPEAPIHSERAVSLCSPALLTSSLPTECAQRTGASLIPLIWGVPWDLTKHSSDKDMRSQRCRGIPTVGGRQTDWVRLWDGETEKCFLQTMRTLTWHRPLGDFFLPLHPSLYHLPPPPTPICPHLPFVNACLRINAPNANQTGDHPLSPGSVCGYSTRRCFWSLTPDCSPLHLQG